MKAHHQGLQLVEYVYNAMSKAHYRVLEDGTYYAEVSLCPGVWATGETVEECRESLKQVLVEWVFDAHEERGSWVELVDLAMLNPSFSRTAD